MTLKEFRLLTANIPENIVLTIRRHNDANEWVKDYNVPSITIMPSRGIYSLFLNIYD